MNYPTPFGSWDLLTAARQVMAGLPVETLDWLKEALDVTDDELAFSLLLAPRTLARRRKEDRLMPDESERVYRLVSLLDLAASTLGGHQEARKWMKEPNFALGEEVPLSLARTEPGAQLVERTLRQIAHGVTV